MKSFSLLNHYVYFAYLVKTVLTENPQYSRNWADLPEAMSVGFHGGTE